LASTIPSLATLGGLAERYFRDDPPTALIKLRQLAEALAKLVAAHHALYLGERETFEQTLRRLSYDGILPRPIIEVFHRVRTLGNIAAHEGKGTHGDALSALKLAREGAVWFHRTYGKESNFRPGPFKPPAEPEDATLPLKAEIEALRQRLAYQPSAHPRWRGGGSFGNYLSLDELYRSPSTPPPRREPRQLRCFELRDRFSSRFAVCDTSSSLRSCRSGM
jgi:type I restriction enzyme R subunit